MIIINPDKVYSILYRDLVYGIGKESVIDQQTFICITLTVPILFIFAAACCPFPESRISFQEVGFFNCVGYITRYS